MDDYERRLLAFRNRGRPEQAASDMEGMSFNELRRAAKEAGILGYGKMTKAELIAALKE